MCIWCSGNTTSFQVVVGSSNLPMHSIPANHRRFMGHSFNGRTVALQASNEGSTPSWSTDFRNHAALVEWKDASLSRKRPRVRTPYAVPYLGCWVTRRSPKPPVLGSIPRRGANGQGLSCSPSCSRFRSFSEVAQKSFTCAIGVSGKHC